jgi:hypothetical protein
LSQEIIPVLGGDYNSVLYKASFDIGKKHFSGLFFFKQVADSAVRVVLLSEVGLNLLDMEFKNGEFTLINCNELLNKKILINTLKKDLRLLIEAPKNKSKQKLYTKKDSYVLKQENQYYFFCNSDSKQTQIIQKSAFKDINIQMPSYREGFPKEILISNKKINLTINLRLLKVEKN